MEWEDGGMKNICLKRIIINNQINKKKLQVYKTSFVKDALKMISNLTTTL